MKLFPCSNYKNWKCYLHIFGGILWLSVLLTPCQLPEYIFYVNMFPAHPTTPNCKPTNLLLRVFIPFLQDSFL